MADRGKDMGDMRAIRAKMAARYDPNVEAEVIGWFKELLGVTIDAGIINVEKALRNGVYLVQLMQKIYEGTPSKPEACDNVILKPNEQNIAFKQLENIQMYLNAANAYGVPETCLFPTADLFEGRNMAQVLASILCVGSEAKRHHFNGSTIGPNPITTNKRSFSSEQKRASKQVLRLQLGTNQFASQKGMTSMGAVRHISDIKSDSMDKTSEGLLISQSGWNKGDSQAGTRGFGAARHCKDIAADDQDKVGMGLIPSQSGWNKGDSQTGMRIGGVRHANDIKSGAQDKTSESLLISQSGWNKGDSQKGMRIGSTRHCSDIAPKESATKESEALVPSQSGWNKGDSQKGMRIGSVRHCSDIGAEEVSIQEANSIIPAQMGWNKGDSQKGMKIGALRHVSDMPIEDSCDEGKTFVNLQMGSNQGASQAGHKFTFGRARMIVDHAQEEQDQDEDGAE